MIRPLAQFRPTTWLVRVARALAAVAAGTRAGCPCHASAAILICVIVPFGCAKPAGELFPRRDEPLVWPAPPERARIVYVGELATSADLKAAVKFTQRLGSALFGRQPVRSMLTPYALCTDEKNRLFVADTNAQVVHVFDLRSRKYARWAPNNRTRRFSQPLGVAYDPARRRLYVADGPAGHVAVFNDRGKMIGTIGESFLKRPCGLAFDSKNRRLFVADVASHEVLVVSPAGGLIRRIGRRGTGLREFNFPTNIALDREGRLYVSDSLNFRVQQFSPDLLQIRQIGRKGDMPGYFGQPKGVAVDGEDHLYVVDAHFEAVQIFDAEGNLLMDFGSEGRGAGEFWLPAGIFIDSNNRIWIADGYNRRVQVFDYLPEGRP